MQRNGPAPDPEVPAKATRRRFSAAEKARILEEYDRASAIERAAICRRERIYTSHLSQWRKRSKIAPYVQAETADQTLSVTNGVFFCPDDPDPHASAVDKVLTSLGQPVCSGSTMSPNRESSRT